MLKEVPTETSRLWNFPRPSAAEFQAISELARTQAGIELAPGKEELVSGRLARYLREGQHANYGAYLKSVQADITGASLRNLIDALTTNHTSFFRERAHFDFLRQQALPSLSTRSNLTIWSSACATGEEPYSLAMWILEHFPGQAGRTQIVASDISTKALATAKRGVYSQSQCASIAPELLARYFQKGQGASTGFYRIRPEVTRMVQFRECNLVQSLAAFPRVPIILCRNVMIYFSPETQTHLLRQLTDHLDPDGYLLVGHAESLSGVKHTLQYVQTAIYQRPRASGGAG